MCQAEEMRPHPKITTLKVYLLLCSECHGLYTKEPTSSLDGKADHLKQHVDSVAHSQVGVSVETVSRQCRDSTRHRWCPPPGHENSSLTYFGRTYVIGQTL